MIEHVGSIGPAWHCNVCSGVFVKTLSVVELWAKGKKQPREEWDLVVNCPEHQGKMDFVTVNGITIDICTDCGGVWLDGGEIDVLLGLPNPGQAPSDGSSPPSKDGDWSGVDFLSPLIDAALNALFRHSNVQPNPAMHRTCVKSRAGLCF